MSIGPTEFREVLGNEDAEHLREVVECALQVIPVDHVEVAFIHDVLVVEMFLCRGGAPMFVDG